ncbi:MAG: hypothetical protein ACRDYX_02150 [Egibacteraceae bacterium]
MAASPPSGRRAWRPQLPRELAQMVEEALLPSPNSIELDRPPQKEYLHRLRAQPVQIAELFCENSKITPVDAQNQPLDTTLVERTREWYHRTAYRPRDGDIDDELATHAGMRVAVVEFPVLLGTFCSALVEDQPAANLLYALDLFLVFDLCSYRLMPHGSWAWLDRTFVRAERERLTSAIRGVPDDARRDADALLFVAVAPWRYMLFQGPRGYRRTLFDVGRFLERCEAIAQRTGIALVSTADFLDHEVDRLLLLDGVERSAHALCLLDTRQKNQAANS